MFRVPLWLLALLVLPALAVAAAPMRAGAAEMTTHRTAPPPVSVAEPPPAILIDPAYAERQQRIIYGCRRIWRCDAEVCEWRRGCHGIYGYVEGPYYSLRLARRQWERDGWPTPRRHREN